MIGVYGGACLEAAFWTCIMQFDQELVLEVCIVFSVQDIPQTCIECKIYRQHFMHTQRGVYGSCMRDVQRGVFTEMAIGILRGLSIEVLFQSLRSDYLEIVLPVLPLYKVVTVEAVPCAWVAECQCRCYFRNMQTAVFSGCAVGVHVIIFRRPSIGIYRQKSIWTLCKHMCGTIVSGSSV